MTAPEHCHSVGDTLATVVLGVLTALAAAASFVISPFFVMVTDACGPDSGGAGDRGGVLRHRSIAGHGGHAELAGHG